MHNFELLYLISSSVRNMYSISRQHSISNPSAFSNRPFHLSRFTQRTSIHKLTVLVASPCFIIDAHNYRSFMSTQCFVNINLLPNERLWILSLLKSLRRDYRVKGSLRDQQYLPKYRSYNPGWDRDLEFWKELLKDLELSMKIPADLVMMTDNESSYSLSYNGQILISFMF